MKHDEKLWLSKVTWDRVLSLNQNLCQTQNTAHEVREKNGQKARDLWEKSVSRKMPLHEALDVCRQCCHIAPFTFNNGNTFANIGKSLIEEWLSRLPSVEAQIVRTTVSHYVAEHAVGRRELMQVLEHCSARWHINGVEHPAPAAAAAVNPLQVPASQA